ncbi:MAG: hypothetical protein OXE75_03045 [bacterium]|nr:hypothetical protein [bacterium]
MFDRVAALAGPLLLTATALGCSRPAGPVPPSNAGAGQEPPTDPATVPGSERSSTGTVAQTRSTGGYQFRHISAGWSHSCGIRNSGIVTCWGDNASGQSAAPAGPFSAVAAGGASTCGIRADGTVECWGNNALGQAEAPAGRFELIIAGGGHMCGLRTDGTTDCWGWNVAGQTDAPPGHFSGLTAGWAHTCGLRTEGTIDCWGGAIMRAVTGVDWN